MAAEHAIDADGIARAARLARDIRDAGALTNRHRWPEQIAGAHAVVADALRRARDADPDDAAAIAVGALCELIGGGHVWWPKASTMTRLLRDARIWEARRQGASAAELADRFGLSKAEVYAICAAQQGGEPSPYHAYRGRKTRRA